VNVRTEFPRRVRVVDHAWIALSDGTRLAAKFWLPEDAEESPVPAILEYIPYRKTDWTWNRDEPIHPWFAGHGYACVRVDLRGAGDSDGILLDEYLKQEQDDAVEVLRWIGEQPWCIGRAGMFGISWGGFNGLQVGARRPPELGAVITLMSTDDRYADDVHYIGGSLLAIDMLPWAATMLAWNGTRPDPGNRGDDWRETWIGRLRETPPYIEAWIAHQRRDDFWRHGSVCEDYAAIDCPVLAVGGWVDGYRSAVLRLLEGLPGECKGLIGPWGHGFPHDAQPGPGIGFLQDCLRFWDRWLKDEPTGYNAEPALRAWMQDWAPPDIEPTERPGRWVAEDEWPSPRIEERALVLRTDGGLGGEPGDEAELTILGSELCGLDSGLWCPYGDAADLPTDQRPDDGLSLCFTSEPLDERIEILGFPDARLVLASDRPIAQVCVRLCDVAPEGTSTLVTRGVLNLTHRESHAEPRPLEPGRRYEVTVRGMAIAHSFRVGHRIRVAISPTYWPWLWPSPEPVTLTLVAGASSLVLPVRPPRAEDERVRFEEPETAPPLGLRETETGSASRRVVRDFVSGEVVLTYAHSGGRRTLPSGVEIADEGVETFTIRDGDPLSARVRVEASVELNRDGLRTRIDTESELWCDAEQFHTRSLVRASENGEQIHKAEREKRVPRDHV